MKDIKYYMNLNYPISIEKFEDYDGKIKYAAEITDLPGCSAYDESAEEALKKLEDAKLDWLEVSLEKGLNIPEPVTEDQFSGKFLLRIPAKLHKNLNLAASKMEMSLNQYIRVILEKSLSKDLQDSRIERYMDKKFDEFKALLPRLIVVIKQTDIEPYYERSIITNTQSRQGMLSYKRVNQ